ncbi:hypothetical protein [Roseateles sp. LYH14W]|uniref:hypothetical protein n=1 Tax=Pelomonas parva TaxID=3299032 RepID=UPI0037496593
MASSNISFNQVGFICIFPEIILTKLLFSVQFAIAASFGVLCSNAISQTTQAVLKSHINVATSISGTGDPKSFQQTAISGPISKEVSSTSLAGPLAGYAVAEAMAESSFGALKAFVSSSANNGFSNSRSHAEASFQDLFTISAPGLSNRVGRVTIPLILDYEIDSTFGGFFEVTNGVRLQVEAITGASTKSDYLRSKSNGTTGNSPSSRDTTSVIISNRSAPSTTPMEISFNFVFGRPILINALLQVSAGATGGSQFGVNPVRLGGAVGTTDAANSFYWGGFSALTYNGADISDYSVSSQSGTDWSLAATPVPEASTREILILGLSFLMLINVCTRTSFLRTQYLGNDAVPANATSA